MAEQPRSEQVVRKPEQQRPRQELTKRVISPIVRQMATIAREGKKYPDAGLRKLALVPRPRNTSETASNQPNTQEINKNNTPSSQELQTNERQRNPLVERMMRILQRGGDARKQLEALANEQPTEPEQTEQKPLDTERFSQVYQAIDDLWLNRVDKNSETFKQQAWFIAQNSDILSQALQDKRNVTITLGAVGTMLRLDHIFLRSDARKIIEKNLSLLQAHLKDSDFDEFQKEIMFERIVEALQSGDEPQQQQATAVIEQNLSMIAEGVEKTGGYQEVVKVMVAKNMPVASDLAAKLIQNTERSTYTRVDMLTDLLYSQNTEFQLQGKKQLQEMLSSITNREVSEGEVRRFSQAWQESAKSDESGKRTVESINRSFTGNLADMRDLEKEEPGITHVLESEFGIRDFSRYPYEALLKQFRERDNKNHPYIVVATARYDHNGASSVSANGEALRQLVNDLDGQYGVRFIEAGTKTELLGRLSILNKSYGGEQKIAGMVVRAHGEKDAMTFGENADALKTSDVQKHGNEAVANLFEPSAPFAFISCSTGMAEGIAQGTAETLGVNVTAPEVPTNISAITPVIREGKLVDLIPQFYGEGSARAYIGRRKETSDEKAAVPSGDSLQAENSTTPTTETQPTKTQDIVQRLEQQGIVDYAPNMLDEREKATLIGKISEAATAEGNSERGEVLQELRAFIEQTGTVFPEFSHGMSSDAFPAIARAGIYPSALARGLYQTPNEHMQQLGEGDKGGREGEESWEISAGAGQGGLGTTMAYAEMTNNPTWNPNVMPRDELVMKIHETEQKLQGKEHPVTRRRLERYKKALARLERGIPPDFPVVIGFTRSLRVGGPEALARHQWVLSEPELRELPGLPGKRLVHSVTRNGHELDSEVMLEQFDQVMPLAITTVACPKADAQRAREVLQQERRGDVRVISSEALRELQNFGYDRIVKAEAATKQRLEKNFAFETLQELMS